MNDWRVVLAAVGRRRRRGRRVIAGPPAQVATIVVSPNPAAVDAGSTTELVAQAFDSVGQPIAGVVFAWSCSAPSIASVDQRGVVTGLLAGGAAILASAGGVTGSCTLTVSPATYASATFGTATNQGDVGSTDNSLPLVQYNGLNGQVTGGQLHVSTDDRALVVADVGHTDLTVEADLLDLNNEQGVCVRVVDGNNYYAARWTNLGSTTLAIEKRLAGVLSTIASLDVGTHTGRVGLTAHGSRLIVTLDGAVQFTATDTDLATGTQAGAYGHGALVDNMEWTSPKYDRAPLSGDVYVSATGTDTGAGTQADPLTLIAATQAQIAQDTNVWMIGGTYPGDFTPGMSGASGHPITFRAYNNARVTIDGSWISAGDYLYLRDVEVMNSDPSRTSTQVGGDLSNPTDIPRHSKECRMTGVGCMFIYVDAHDLGNGFVCETGGEGSEAYGCRSHSNGWDGTDRAHGHNLYFHNDPTNTAKLVTACVLFNSFDIGAQLYARSGGLAHLKLADTIVFGSGAASAVYGEQRNIDASNASPIDDLTFNNVSVYRIASKTVETWKINNAGDPPATNITITNCRARGSVSLNECQGYTVTDNTFSSGADVLGNGARLFSFRLRSGGAFAENSFDRNTYATPAGGGSNPFGIFEDDDPVAGVSDSTFAQWQAITGYDANGTFVSGEITTPTITVMPADRYEAGRAHIECINPQDAASLDVDLSSMLAVGDSYEIRHIYDIYGAAVVSGTYDGNPVAIPQAGYVPPTPIGYATTPPSASPTYNVFLLRKVA